MPETLYDASKNACVSRFYDQIESATAPGCNRHISFTANATPLTGSIFQLLCPTSAVRP